MSQRKIRPGYYVIEQDSEFNSLRVAAVQRIEGSLARHVGLKSVQTEVTLRARRKLKQKSEGDHAPNEKSRAAGGR